MSRPTLSQDRTLAVLRGNGTGKRARGPVFTLQLVASASTPGQVTGYLQGPRGKVVDTYTGTPEECTAAAKARASRTGSSLEVYGLDPAPGASAAGVTEAAEVDPAAWAALKPRRP